MLVERPLWGHSTVVVGLSVHVFAKVTVTLAVGSVLTRVVGVVRVVCIIRVGIWVVACMPRLTMWLLLHVLTLLLRCRPTWLLAAQGRVGCVVSAVLGFVVARVRLRLSLRERRLIRPSTECTACSLLGYASFLLAGCALLGVAAIILLVCCSALLLGSRILGPKSLGSRRKTTNLSLGLLLLGLLTGVVVLICLRCLLTKWVVGLLRGCRSFGLTVAAELVVGMLAL